MDRFRVQALDKILSADVLSPAQQVAARDTLLYKSDILLNGANKRGNEDVVAHYRAMIAKHRPEEVIP